MKKLLLSITAILLMVVMPAKAYDYEDIRNEALFLTDKMAYELNLTEEQYEAAFEINFDYLCDVFQYGRYDDYDDLYGRAWTLRNRDLRIILMETQYSMFERLRYFYRPFSWSHGRITIQIYNYYPRRDYLYFGCPNFVVTYRGGHGWRHHRHRSYYSGRAWHRGYECYGMRDGYREGRRYYNNGTDNHGWRDAHRGSHHEVHHGHNDGYRGNGFRFDDNRNCSQGFRGSRGHVSSTRTTVNNVSVNGGFGGNRSHTGVSSSDRRLPDNRFSPRKAGSVDRSSRGTLSRDNRSSNVSRSNRSIVSRSNSSNVSRSNRSNVSRSNRSNVSRSNGGNVSRSDRSRSRSNNGGERSNGGFGGGR